MTAGRPAETAAVAALTAAALIALEPHRLGGVRLKAAAGPVRDQWLARMAACLDPGEPLVRVPAHACAARLTGSIDVLATLAARRPVMIEGLLSRVHGGLLELRSAERVELQTAALLAEALDGSVWSASGSFDPAPAPRFGLVALDEGQEAGDDLPAALAERLGLWVDLAALAAVPEDGTLALRVAAARQRRAHVTVPETILSALAHTAAALGVRSDRALLVACRAAGAAAALAGRMEADAEDAATAAMLVLAPRATQLPPHDESTGDSNRDGEANPPANRPSDPDADRASAGGPLEDRVLDAAMTALPRQLLEALAGRALARRGRDGGASRRHRQDQEARRGRQRGSRAGDPRRGQRLDLLATLRAAVPWQAIRAGGEGLKFRASDLRIRRFRQQRGSTTIFCVDASGSTALERLAEAKGAVEHMLAECYVRRDEVALVVFRGQGAQIVVPPTRSLQRARQCLAGLPGGGGTPLAEGIATACRMARETGLRGRTPTLVLITDGRSNIGFGGVAGRAQAGADALAAAREVGLHGIRSLVIDSSARSEPQARSLAEAMGAQYLALPHADAAMLHDAVRAQMAGGGTGRHP